MTNIQAVWQCRYKVRYGEANRNGALKLRALADYFQEAAAHHADNLGVGLEALGRDNMFWVLSRMGIEIARLPEVNETVTLETWPRHGRSPLFAMREFTLRDAAGEPLIRATSAWLLLDSVSMRPRRISMLPADLPQNGERLFLFEQLDEVADFSGEPWFSEEIRESKIDVNQHLNNAEYFSWLEDCAAESGYHIDGLKRIFINFVNEARRGDRVGIRMENNPQKHRLAVAGVKETENRKVFKSVMEFAG